MVANNQNKWSFCTNDIHHNWTTGKDYVFEVGDDTVIFGSDTADQTEISLELAKDFANMFSDLFGVTIE